uniref:Kinesin motor domain-containing protein n=1 Tax=Cynoglossus semilaevis TaxID=244447 RepID=A0A3P8VNG0_CYNSE
MLMEWNQKLSLTLRKKGQASDSAPAHLSTRFRDIIQKNPPSVPSCLLQAATRTRDSPNVGKVKVVLRVSPTLSADQGQSPVLQIDPAKKRVTIREPFGNCLPQTAMVLGRDGKNLLKTFNFDATYSQESSQAEVCAGVLADVIRCVLSGSDGCVLGLGCADVGSWSSMVGSDESVQKLGLIPCAISWLYSSIERRREKTWTDMTVSVSAIELCCGEEDTLRDLLGEFSPLVGSAQDSPQPRIRLQEDPVYGIQLRNHNRVKAPTAERAASLLDVAIAARRHSDFITYLSHTSVMFFTLHVQPPRTESSTIGKGRLILIDVSSGMRAMSKNKPPYSELGPSMSGHFLLSLHRGSKLTMLLREALGHTNCHVTVMAEIADSLTHLQETLSTVHLAARIRRTQKRTKVSSPVSSPVSNRPQPFSLRAFHSTDEVDVDNYPLRLRGDLDEHSGSEQSCDTVIQIGSDGFINSKAAGLTQPKFVPIIPSLNPNKSDLDDPEFTGEKKKDEMDCLKCETFAELQERLGCIDGSEVPSVNDVSTKSHPRKENGKHTSTKALKAPQGLLNQGLGCSQTAEGEKKTDGAFPGDSFQREDSGLYDCEECSAASSSEEILNQALGLNTNCCAEHPNTGTPKLANKLPSKSCGETTAGVSPALQSADKQEGLETAEWFKPDKRTSPVGKSSPISPSSSCSSSHSVANSVVHKDVLPNCPAKDVKEMKATITVTVQQPLDLKGQDELVFSMVEEVTISGALNSGRTGGNIICIRDQQHSNTEGLANSQPIRIISNVSEESLAAGSPDNTVVSVVESAATETTAKPQHQCRREKGFIPSFINPIGKTNVSGKQHESRRDVDCDVDGGKEKQMFQENNTASDIRGNHFKNPEDRNMNEKRKKVFESQTQLKKLEKPRDSAFSEIPYDSVDSAAFGGRSADDAVERGNAGDRRHPGDEEHVFSSSNSNGSSEGGKCIGNAPRRICVLPCCQETAPTPFETGSSPQGWQNANVQDCYLISSRRDTRGMTSSTPCSPGVTPDKRPGRTSPLNHGLQVSSPFKCGTELTQKAGSSSRQGVASVSETSNPRIKHEGISGRQQSPPENSGRLFSARLEQLACKTNSLGRAPRDFPTLYRGSSNTSMSSKGSSRGSNEGACRRSHHYSSQISVNQPSKHSHSKLSAVGKLKMAAPKARRLSAPSIKNVSMTHRGLSQSGSRSSSISPESKNDGLEANSSRTPSQSSTCSSTKSAIQGFVNGRIAELLKERSASPGSAELDEVGSIPSPYSRLTAPRSPDHLSGHASDTTSVLSGDLPPAMGKTSLYFSNRNSTVSSGYDSLLRDGETASNRDSVSDRSGSLLSATRSSRSSRKKGSTASHQRRPSKEETMSLRRSPSGLRSRWADRGIPEAYEIKVYEIDNLQRMQKRAGAGKTLPGSLGVLLKYDQDDHRWYAYHSLRTTDLESTLLFFPSHIKNTAIL